MNNKEVEEQLFLDALGKLWNDAVIAVDRAIEMIEDTPYGMEHKGEMELSIFLKNYKHIADRLENIGIDYDN